MGDIIQLRPKETQADGEETLSQMADVNDVISEDEIIWHCTHCGHPLFSSRKNAVFYARHVDKCKPGITINDLQES